MDIDFKPYPFVAERHPAHLPACDDGIDTHRHRVAIVGGGPSASPSRSVWRTMASVAC